MLSKQIEVNNQTITAFANGCIEKPFWNRLKLTFGHGSQGYMRVHIGDKTFQVHRLIAKALLPDYSEDLTVDHIDGDKKNNTAENLRMMSHLDQLKAHRNKEAGCSSEYRGVAWHKQRGYWVANINIDGLRKYLGTFTDEMNAAKAYDAAAIAAGFFPESLNFCPIDASPE